MLQKEFFSEPALARGGFGRVGPLSPMIGVMNYDEKIAEYKQQMHDAEDALVEKGFSEEHWLLIRDYVLSAISLHSVIMAQSDSVHYSPRPVRMS